MPNEPEESPRTRQEIDAEYREEAHQILNSLQPIEEIKNHLDNLVAGEDSNKKLVFILLLSGKVKDPIKKIMILLKGTAGVGKTTLMIIADLFKTKTIGRLSETALDYIADLTSYEVVKLQELGTMDYDKTLKFVSADDRGYSVEVTISARQEGANAPPFKTFSRRIPAITLITSTTRIGIESQFRRRSWIINLDESKEQTEEIRLWKIRRRKEEDKLAQGLIPEMNYERSKRILKALVELIEPVQVIIPFKDCLTKLLPVENVEVRGHYDKLLNLVYLYAVLLQNQLPKLNDRPVITADRALEALELSKDAFEAMSSMESRVAILIKTLVEEGIDKDSLIDKEERIRLAKKIGKSPRTILTYFNFLENE